MNRPLRSWLGLWALGLWALGLWAPGVLASAARADDLQCVGILGNSGEQGTTLVRFGDKEASGLGVACDRYGSLWDRGGAGVLNRYALDGRLLATYRLPEHPSNRMSDAIALAGDQVLIRSGNGLYTVSIDAPSGSAAKSLNVSAEWMSPSARDGWVAAANKGEVFRVNPAGERQPVAVLKASISGIELGPDGAVYVVERDRVGRVAAGAGAPAPAGPAPGERAQWLAGAWFGHAWASTVRRFDPSLHPDPGVVLGGNSGSFIGHVDEQAEVVNGRGMARVSAGLFAISGLNGIVHLLEWSPAEHRFTPVRRLGAVRTCSALALDRDGRVWYSSGAWEWNDGPATPLRHGIPPGEVFGATLLDSDVMVAYGRQYGKPAFYFGKLGTEVKRRLEEKPTALPRRAVAVVAAELRRRSALLILGNDEPNDGQAAAIYLGADGSNEGDAGRVRLITAAPVRQWTALAGMGPGRLAGAADGLVIELARDGDHWRETGRWNSWGQRPDEKFGDSIFLAADGGRLWVSDTRRHRVLCFDAADKRLLGSFGSVDSAGDGLAALNAPQTLAARGRRAVIFDSGNQRLVRLELRPDSR